MEAPQSVSTISSDCPPKSESDLCVQRWRHLQEVESKGLQGFEIASCAGDVVYWLENWGWTYDPRREPSFIAFAPWPKQVEFLRWLEGKQRAKKPGLVEKTRDAGVSWLCCAFAVHQWLFRDGASIGFGSRKENYVDTIGDPKSLLEKIRILIDSMPSFMKPAGYDRLKHATFCKIVNPANGSTITGEAGDNIGRGARCSTYFVDEAAFIERPELVDRALSATTEVRIDVSTPNGMGNTFYTKRHAGIVDVFTFSWRHDPRKTQEWYDEKVRTEDPVLVAQEIDISYTASIEGIFIPAEWVAAAIELDLPEGNGPIIAGQDIAEEGRDKSVFIPRRGPVALTVVSWGQCHTNETAYKVVELCREWHVSLLHYDAVGVGTGPKGTWTAMGEDLPFVADPIYGGAPPSDHYWPDGKTSKEKFQDVNGELWMRLRERFERTYEYVREGVDHPLEDLISIPDHPDLRVQLSIPKRVRNDRDKVARESKRLMALRGIHKSPDFAEALAYAFAPDVDYEFAGSDPRESVITATRQAFAPTPSSSPSVAGHQTPRKPEDRAAADDWQAGNGDGTGVDWMNVRF